ncbi:hypothetical protein L0337_32735, partial [candidate division KSB1 bacterium]|nr:hypothetical protein [candidate division KSB1 bacterium]
DMTEHLAVCWNYFVPHYSTKIAAAFEVVEKLRELGKGQQFADCYVNETPWHWVFLKTEFFCLHICRAALKAVSATGSASAGLADQDRQI